MDTASAAQAAIPSRVKRSVEAKPDDHCAITRMPMPYDSDSASAPTWPFFVERSRRRMSMTRASAYVAPRTFAVSSAQLAKYRIMDSEKKNQKHLTQRTQRKPYVPSDQDARYNSCSGVSLSIWTPIDSSLSFAIWRSMASGTTYT